MLDQEELEALLGRSLTAREVTNIDLYLDISTERLTDLLCEDVTISEEDAERVFDSREGYRTLPVGVFRTVSVVSVDGETVDAADYTVMQGDKRSGSWKNLIVFKKPMLCDKDYTVTADWGFGETEASGDDPAEWQAPSDVKLLLAQLFNLVSKGQKTDTRLQSKKIEDTSFTFRDVTLDDQFLTDNGRTIQKYSACGWPEVRNGRVRRLSDC